MVRLDDKVAIITGAASGVGRIAALLFAKEGAQVVATDISVAEGEKTVAMIKEAGGDATFVSADVARAEGFQSVVKAAVDSYGRLDILYNNAGISGASGSTVDCTEENWNKTVDVDLKSVWLGMKYAIPAMLKTGGGSIVNTGSQAATRGMPNLPAYAAAKGGVVSLTRATAIEFATQNIRVNCINPGIIATPMSMGAGVNPEDYKNLDEYKHLSTLVPQRRVGETIDVAQAALFLASDESSHITGQILGVDGGMEADSHVERDDERLNK